MTNLSKSSNLQTSFFIKPVFNKNKSFALASRGICYALTPGAQYLTDENLEVDFNIKFGRPCLLSIIKINHTMVHIQPLLEF